MSDKVENFLAHYGVQGMKWGHRKRADNYSDEQRSRDIAKYGAGAARRNNKRMLKGMSYEDANRKERNRRLIGLGATVAAVAVVKGAQWYLGSGGSSARNSLFDHAEKTAYSQMNPGIIKLAKSQYKWIS